MSSTAGIDFGNENIVVAVPSKGSIEIVFNESSNRITPSLATYTGERRYAGELAAQNQMQYIKSTISQLKRLIQLKYDSEERKQIEALVSFPLTPLEDGTTGVKVPFKEETLILRPEQIIAYLLKSVSKYAINKQPNVKKFVIAIAPWWQDHHRQAIFDSCRISGLNCVSLINSTTAAAISYATIHSDRLPANDKEPVPVAFIDFGNSSMNVIVALLKQQSIEIKSIVSDEHLGGNSFTTPLVDYLLKIVQEKYKIDPSSNPRAMLRFRAAVEKVKKTLSINPLVQFEIQNLMNDIDVKFNVKREEFNSQIAHLLEKMPETLNKAVDYANIKKEDLFAIEALGGGSRVVAVREKITEVYGKEPTRSLNLDECFAYGAAYMGGLIAAGSAIPFKVQDITPHGYEIQLPGQETKVIFSKFSPIKTTASVELEFPPETAEMELVIRTDNTFVIRESPTSDEEEAETEKEETEKEEEEAKKEEEAETETEKEETEKEEAKKEEEAEAEKEEAENLGQNTAEKEVIGTLRVKKNGEESKFKLNFELNSSGMLGFLKAENAEVEWVPVRAISEEQINEMIKLEEELVEKDGHEKNLDDSINNLQSLIFKAQNAIERDYPESFNPSQIESNKQQIGELFSWFSDNEFDRLPIDEYLSRTEILKNILDPVEKIHQSHQKVEEVLTPLKAKLDQLVEQIQKDQERSGLPEGQTLLQEIKTLINKISEITSIPKFEEVPAYDPKEYTTQGTSLEEKTKKFLETPIKKAKAKYQNEPEPEEEEEEEIEAERQVPWGMPRSSIDARRKSRNQNKSRSRFGWEDEKEEDDPWRALFGQPARRQVDSWEAQQDARRRQRAEQQRREQQTLEQAYEEQRRQEEEKRRQYQEMLQRKQEEQRKQYDEYMKQQEEIRRRKEEERQRRYEEQVRQQNEAYQAEMKRREEAKRQYDEMMLRKRQQYENDLRRKREEQELRRQQEEEYELRRQQEEEYEAQRRAQILKQQQQQQKMRNAQNEDYDDIWDRSWGGRSKRNQNTSRSGWSDPFGGWGW